MRERFTALAEAAAQVASPQLRNQGTLGGNLCQKPRCWYYRGDFACLRKGGELCYAYAGENEFHAVVGGGPCYIVHPSDTAPALAALGAIAHVVGPKGSRTVPLDRFFVLPAAGPDARDGARAGRDPDEAPAAEAGGRACAAPTARCARAASFDFALVGAAHRAADAGRPRRPRPRRPQRRRPGAVAGARRSRRRSRAAVSTATTIATAAAAAVAKLEPLEKNAYKVPLLRGLVQERLEALAGA